VKIFPVGFDVSVLNGKYIFPPHLENKNIEEPITNKIKERNNKMDARQRQSDICQDDENQAPSLYSTILVFLSQQNKKRIGKLAIRMKHLQLLYNYCFFPTAMVPSCSTSWLFLMMILSRR
jgi:hypothetical protein